MSRRGFLAAGIGGLAALLTGGKSLTTGVKTGILASKAASEIAAPGMPSWFPLLVDKIYKNGTKIKNAQPGKGSIESVYQLDASAYNGIDDLRMYESINENKCFCIAPNFRNFTFEVFLALIAGASAALTLRFFL